MYHTRMSPEDNRRCGFLEAFYLLFEMLAWNMGQASWPVSTVHLAIFEIRGVLFVCFSFVFRVRVSSCSLGCPGIFSVDQTGLTFAEICLPLLLSAGMKGKHYLI